MAKKFNCRCPAGAARVELFKAFPVDLDGRFLPALKKIRQKLRFCKREDIVLKRFL